MNQSISILLGAGFSAPMGYPVGNELNQLLLNCNGDNFAFHSSGVLVASIDGKKPDFGFRTTYDVEFEFCKELIWYFNKLKGYFDYEEFYDFIKDSAYNDDGVLQLAKPYLNENWTIRQLIYALENIYTQLVAYYLKDKNGDKFYDNQSFLASGFIEGYTGIFNCLKEISNEFNINIHTLNHDLLFERFNNTFWLNGELCDGFEEIGSPYYGKLAINGRTYHVRLERYTGNYDKKFRLYKLHGSLDYCVFYSKQITVSTPEKYLKCRYGVDIGYILKETKNEIGELIYEDCWLNYHSDFLTGTTSKIERYKEPLIYKSLFELFRKNLKEAKLLMIIGYGGKDTEVNKMIVENYDFKCLPSIIIDPYAGGAVVELAKCLNSKLIEDQLENIKIDQIFG